MTSIALLARVCLVILFPFSGIDKVVHWDAAIKQANSSPLGGAPVMLIAAIAIELTTPVCIVIGWHPAVAAIVLAAFCVATAILFHPFWRFPGFWAGGNPEGAAHFWDFLKNFGLVGGLLLVVLAATSIAPPAHVVASVARPPAATGPVMGQAR